MLRNAGEDGSEQTSFRHNKSVIRWRSLLYQLLSGKTEHERPWQWTFSWGFLAQQEPDTRPTFPPWLICQIYPADGGDNIIIWRLFCIHLFEPAGRLIFFCVDYTFMTQFSAITGLRLPLSDFLSAGRVAVSSHMKFYHPVHYYYSPCPPVPACSIVTAWTNGDSTNSAAVLSKLSLQSESNSAGSPNLS